MWISKAEYETLKLKAEINADNHEKAKTFDNLMMRASAGEIVMHDNNMVMSHDTMVSILRHNGDDKAKIEERLKEVEAELTWYKVKYFELTHMEVVHGKHEEQV